MKLIIDDPRDLQGFSLVTSCITDTTRYRQFQLRTQQGFIELQSTNPWLEDRPYQRNYAAVMCSRRNNIMAYDMGLGKTFVSLLTIYGLYHPIENHRRGRVQIVVPSILSAQRWIQDLNSFPSLKDHYELVDSEAQLVKSTKPILIYTQEFPKRGTKKKGKKMSRLFYKIKPSLLIIDEGHTLRNNSDRTKHLSYVRNQARRCMVLSGTIAEDLSQFYNVCKFVYKDWPYPNIQSFSRYYTTKVALTTSIYGTNESKREIAQVTPERLPEFYELSRAYIHRVQINEPDIYPYLSIPESEVVLHRLEPTVNQKKAHQQLLSNHRDKLKRIAEGGEKQVAEALRLLQPFVALANFPEELSHKLKLVKEIIDQAEGKVVIFTDRVSSARAVQQYLNNFYPGSVVRLYSKDPYCNPPELSVEQRNQVVEEFQYNSQVKAGIFSISLSAESIDLTQGSDVIYYCLSWRNLLQVQSHWRVVRPGNKIAKVNLHYPYQVGLVDEHQVTLSAQKSRALKTLLNYEVVEEQRNSMAVDAIKLLLGDLK